MGSGGPPRMTHPLFSLLVLGLLALAVAPLAAAGEERPPATTVADWILAGDDAETARAIRALHSAPTSYLAEVVQALRARAEGVGVFPDESPEVSFVATESGTVMIDLDVWTVPKGTTAQLWDPSTSNGQTMRFLDAADLETTRKKLLTSKSVTDHQEMSLLVFDREEGNLAITEEVSFVEGYTAEDATSSNPKITPRIGTIHEGITLSVRPVISADGGFVTLEMDLRHLAIQRPIPKSTVTIGKNGQEIELEAPVTAETPSRLTVRVPDGATVALTGFRDQRTPYRELIALVRATIPSGGAPRELPDPSTTDATTFINLEAKVLRVAPDVATRVLGDRIPDAEPPYRLLDAKQVLGLLGKDRAGAKGITVLATPRLTTYDGQKANVSLLNQTSYVRDFEVESKDGQTILDPIVDTIQHGLVLEVTPRIADDRKSITIDALTTWAELSRPIAEFTTTLEGQEVTIQLPELQVMRSRVKCSVPPGGYVLLGGLGDGDEGPRFVLIRASLVTADDLTPR